MLKTKIIECNPSQMILSTPEYSLAGTSEYILPTKSAVNTSKKYLPIIYSLQVTACAILI